MDTYALDGLWQELTGLFPEYEIDFDELMELLLTGDVFGVGKRFVQMLFTGIGMEMESVKTALITILVVGMVAAMVSQLAGVFTQTGTSEMSFFIFYLFLSTVLLKVFGSVLEMARDAYSSRP